MTQAPADVVQANLQSKDGVQLTQPSSQNPTAALEHSPSNIFNNAGSAILTAKKASKQRVNTTIIEEDEKDTDFDRRQSQIVSADAKGANIIINNLSSIKDLSTSKKPDGRAPPPGGATHMIMTNQSSAEVLADSTRLGISDKTIRPFLPPDTPPPDAA